MRSVLEQAEEQRLGPWALCSRGATRRHPIEDVGRAFDYRTAFQRDRDRIVYSRAFRRLRQKAQVGILPDYEDHRRNRLTHTLEVTQLARTIGRALRLNEDLVEAIALGHDVGQPPFGPIGARALDALLSGRLDGRGGPGLGDLGGFQRAWQSLRVVDRVEKRYDDHAGLNLSDPVREGVFKSGAAAPPSEEPGDGLRPGLASSFEAQVVVLADRIAPALHDLDDALQAGAVDLGRIERLQAVRQLKRKLGAAYPTRPNRFMKANAIHRGLIHLLVTAAVVEGRRELDRFAAEHAIEDHARFLEVRDAAIRGTEIALPAAAARVLEEIEGFLVAHVRRGRDADQAEAQGKRILVGLFAAYQADPTLLDDHVLIRFKQASGAPYLRDVARENVEGIVRKHYRGDSRFVRVLADHLAAMTDTFAVAEHGRLTEIGAVPIPSAEQLRREQS
jgi:dGTPase